jgi:hypothetical protein
MHLLAPAQFLAGIRQLPAEQGRKQIVLIQKVYQMQDPSSFIQVIYKEAPS